MTNEQIADLLTPKEVADIVYYVFYPGPLGGSKERLAAAILDKIRIKQGLAPIHGNPNWNDGKYDSVWNCG